MASVAQLSKRGYRYRIFILRFEYHHNKSCEENVCKFAFSRMILRVLRFPTSSRTIRLDINEIILTVT